MLKTASLERSDKKRNNATFKLLQKHLNSFRNGLATKKIVHVYNL